MSTYQFPKILTASAAFTAVAALGLSISSSTGLAASDDTLTAEQEQMIQIGLSRAPVPLNMAGKDSQTVGLGSFLVNVSADCNGCHTNNPATQFTPTGNPYMLIPPNGPYGGVKQTNTATYLGGGQDFGVFPSPGGTVHIISRNLTPDKTGMPEGHTLAEFMQMLKTGADLDHLHPNCPTNGPNCMLPPFNGGLLQVMPWTSFQNMTDNELKAIYTYLSAVPCLEGGPGQPSPRCN